jgi:hypothetical protein
MSEVPNATPAREVQAGGTIRFAVGSPTGLRSSTWRIWSAKHTKDVYLAARSIAGLQKVSLHESQSWSHSFVSDERAKPFITPGSSRHVDIWPAPPSFGEGWRRGYCIIVPSTDLRPWPQPEPGDIAFAPLPGTGYWVYIEVILVAAGTTTRLVFDEMHLIGSMSLVDGSEVKIAARRVRPTRDEAGRLALAREQALAQIASMPNPRLLLQPDANLRLAYSAARATERASGRTSPSCHLRQERPPFAQAAQSKCPPIQAPSLADASGWAVLPSPQSRAAPDPCAPPAEPSGSGPHLVHNPSALSGSQRSPAVRRFPGRNCDPG